jgi:hypothetical protein
VHRVARVFNANLWCSTVFESCRSEKSASRKARSASLHSARFLYIIFDFRVTILSALPCPLAQTGHRREFVVSAGLGGCGEAIRTLCEALGAPFTPFPSLLFLALCFSRCSPAHVALHKGLSLCPRNSTCGILIAICTNARLHNSFH